MNLSTKISQFSRVRKTVVKRLEKLGVKTVADLLFYFPFRYDDFRQVVKVKDLREGMAVTVKARLEFINNKHGWKSRKTITEALVSDDSGSLRVVWFNQPYLAKSLKNGEWLFLSGKVKSDMLGAQLTAPVYEKVSVGVNTSTACLAPIYPLTAGLTQKQVRVLAREAMMAAGEAKEWLPEEIMESADLTPLPAALAGIHFPKDEIERDNSIKRLKFGELFLLQLKCAVARAKKLKQKAPVIDFKEQEIKDFVVGLPFALTKSQKVSAWEILQDLAKAHPMNRLLSGEVGSGKTVVAAMAAYDAVLNGFQAVILAPTEILASQHYNSFKKLLPNNKIGLLTNSQYQISNIKYQKDTKAGERREVIKNIKDGLAEIIVGTHAVLSDKIKFNNLGLIVIDEQHRFGVEQRRTLKERAKGAHFLSMTATPIPRSLALLIYGDLDLSAITELPPGRKLVMTRLVESANRQKAYDFIREQIKKGRQAFVVCPLIEEKVQDFGIEIINYPIPSDKKSVLSEFEKLSKKIFPDLRVGYLHGRMPARGGSASGGKGEKSKDEVMGAFRNHEIDILVSTSVVEVGVDIPNASVMMIEGAERFGLAQLHQFRGRVGRAEHQSYCFLFTTDELNSEDINNRLKYFEKHNDGFKLAEYDLERRGPGAVYGIEQSGHVDLKLATLGDRDIIKLARDLAGKVVENLADYPTVVAKIKDFDNKIHWE